MNRLHLLCSALTLALATSACDRRDATENAPTPEPDTAVTEVTNPTAPVEEETETVATPATDDSLALGLLAAVNEHEIEAAKQAQSKQVSAPVLQYARMMEKDHGDNLAKTTTLGTLASTPEVRGMQEKGKSDVAELGKKSGKEYEAAYVEAMVKGHTDALALIDGRLQSLASVGPVKDHLIDTRARVAMHLEEARKLQAKG